jgi:shikimate dehydrogenase
MDEIRKFCVFGLPVKHSLSPLIHKEFAKQQGINIQYKLIEPDSEEHFDTHAQSFFSKKGYGANITIPFKEKAYNFADSYDTSAIECNCANTLMLKDNEIRAFNTDGHGFINDLTNKGISLSEKKILILGAGGSAKGIINSLVKGKIKKIHILTRTISKADELISQYKDSSEISHYKDSNKYDLIINTTPISLNDDSINFPTDIFEPNSVSYDLFYSKVETKFQSWSKENGAGKIYDGLGMLIQQAALSFDIWNNFKPDTKGLAEKLGF